MTEARYRQLKKREEWLGIILDYCDGEEVSLSAFNEAVNAAKHFQSDMISKTYRYENAELFSK